MEKVIIVDIDGTLANIDHRLHFFKQKPKDWKSFFEAMVDDTVNMWCKSLIVSHRFRGHKVILCTGRPEDYKKKTIGWLASNYIFYNEIYFRKSGDFRDDATVKLEILRQKIIPKYKKKNILFVVDDRQRVVDMWREQGLVCLQCAKGDY